MTNDYFKEDIIDNAISENQKKRMKKRSANSAKIERKKARRKRIKQSAVRNTRVLLVCLVVGLIVFAFVGSTLFKIFELSREKAVTQEKFDSLNETSLKLQEELNQVESKEYIEQQARSELRMIKPGEKLYVVLDEKNAGN